MMSKCCSSHLSRVPLHPTCCEEERSFGSSGLGNGLGLPEFETISSNICGWAGELRKARAAAPRFQARGINQLHSDLGITGHMRVSCRTVASPTSVAYVVEAVGWAPFDVCGAAYADCAARGRREIRRASGHLGICGRECRSRHACVMHLVCVGCVWGLALCPRSSACFSSNNVALPTTGLGDASEIACSTLGSLPSAAPLHPEDRSRGQGFGELKHGDSLSVGCR